MKNYTAQTANGQYRESDGRFAYQGKDWRRDMEVAARRRDMVARNREMADQYPELADGDILWA